MRGCKRVASVVVACSSCGAKSDPVVPTSPAAPVLTALEQLKPLGWAYQIGFFSMMTGDYVPLCPKCAASAKETT